MKNYGNYDYITLEPNKQNIWRKNRKIVFLYVQIIVKKIIQQHKTQLFEFF